MVSLKAKKRMTYFTLGSYFLMGGIEYAVILPSVWLYIHTRFKAEEYFLGLTLSAFCLSGLFSGPIMGRWADKSRQVRLILMLAAVFEMAGSFMYFIGFSTWFLVGSRLVSGVGVGGEAVILAEIARFTSEEERTGVISILIAVRQCGLLLGPGFNFFLSRIDFDIGPFPVDKFTSPGLLMTLIWLIMEVFLVCLFTEPETLFNKMRVMQHIETTYAPIQNSDDDDQYTAILPSSTQVTYDDVYPEVSQTTQDGVPSTVPIQKGIVTSDLNVSASVGNSSIMNVSVGSVGSVDSTLSIGNSTSLIESAEVIIQTDSAANSDKTKLLKQQNSRRKKKKDLLDSVSSSCNGHSGQTLDEIGDPMAVGKLRFFYNEYIREEIVTLLGLQFITIFVQVALEPSDSLGQFKQHVQTNVSPVQQIYNAELDEEVAVTAPSFASIQASLYKNRGKTILQVPETRAAVSWKNHGHRQKMEETFCASVTGKMLVFGASEMLEIMRTCCIGWNVSEIPDASGHVSTGIWNFLRHPILVTMLTPLTDKYLQWDEFDNSLLYCGAGVEIIIMFLVTRCLSRRLEDRYMLLIGGLVLTVSNAFLMYFLPSCTVDTPMRTLAGLIFGVVLDMIALPFLMVCGVSLYSKLTRKETQGLSQGIRRSVAGVGTILAPLWAGSAITMPYVLVGVILGLLFISQVMFFLSFSRLKVPKEGTPSPVRATSDSDGMNPERQPLLGQIS